MPNLSAKPSASEQSALPFHLSLESASIPPPTLVRVLPLQISAPGRRPFVVVLFHKASQVQLTLQHAWVDALSQVSVPILL